MMCFSTVDGQLAPENRATEVEFGTNPMKVVNIDIFVLLATSQKKTS